jgi:hypothetical protein
MDIAEFNIQSAKNVTQHQHDKNPPNDGRMPLTVKLKREA